MFMLQCCHIMAMLITLTHLTLIILPILSGANAARILIWRTRACPTVITTTLFATRPQSAGAQCYRTATRCRSALTR